MAAESESADAGCVPAGHRVMIVKLATQVLMATAVTYAVIRLAEPYANSWGLVDKPNGRKDHSATTPVTGGIAIFLSMLLVESMEFIEPAKLLAFGAGAGVLVVTGVVDDRFDIRWWVRLLAQAAAALIMIYGGGIRVEHVGHLLELGWVAVPFTVFATIGVINALNMADGVDGLAGSLALAALAMLGAATLYSGNDVYFERLLPVMGAVFGFLLLNVRWPWQPRARVFLGNSGSALLGFIIAWVSFRVSDWPGHPVSGILCPWLLALPLIDCVVLMFRRFIRGRSPFSADHDHMHHLLLEAGYSPDQVVAGLTLLTLAMGLGATYAHSIQVPEWKIIVVFLVVLALYYAFSSNRARAVHCLAVLRRPFVQAASTGKAMKVDAPTLRRR
jgi:UDP-GlcNAc:undecaprenyl-phosphate/decaprenyl-phosphate GlcNAc-1-phosphate transferase